MATKLYLHREGVGTTPQGTLPSGEQSTLAADANLFDNEDGTENRVMNTTVSAQSQTTATNSSTADTSAHNYYIMRWVSPVLYQSRIEANTWTVEYAATESNAAANFPRSSTGAMYVNCYVWNKATGTKVGTVLDGNSNADGEEAGTTQTVINYTFAGAAVTGIVPGECVLVYELWAQVTQGNGTARTQTVAYDGTTENSTTNEAAFVSTPENLQFAANRTARNASIVTNYRAITSTANTTQYWNVVGRQFVTTTENDAKIRFRTAGTISKLSLLLTTNSTTSCAFTVRKNGSDQSLTVTSGSSATGYFEDLTNSFSVAAGDDITLKSVPSATGTFVMAYSSMIFTPTTETDMVTICASTDTTTIATASTTIYAALSGQNAGTSGVEARHKIRQKAAGTYSKLYVWVQSNARTTNTVFKSRKNGADGNLSVTYASGETGLKEDTSNIDTVADGDDYNLAITTSTGTENLVYTIFKVEFTSTNYTGILITQSGTSSTIGTSLTRYFKPGGEASLQTTEANLQFKIRLTDVKLNNMHTYVHTGENTITANSTLKSRKNTADGNLSITYGSSEVGLKSDTSNTDNIGSNDLLAYSIATGATGTTIEFKSITTYYQARTATLSSILKYNIIGRISLSRIYKYNIIGRISQSRIYKWHLQARASLSRIYKWNVEAALERISKSSILKWNIIARASLSRIYKWNMDARVSLSRIYKYNIQERISLSRIYKYHITTAVSLARIYKYNIVGRVSLSRIYKWNLIARVSLSRSYLWNLIGRISLSRIYKYNIQARVSLSSILKYNIQSRISLSRIYKWNLDARVSLSRIYKYHIQSRVSLSSILKYNIIGRISLSRTYLWNVISGELDRVSKSQIYKWNLMSRVSLSRTYLYNILSRISLSRTYLYNIIGRVSLSRIYKYHIQARASLERIYKYNIQARVSLSRIYKWNLESSLERISKSQIYKWNIMARVSLARVLKYDVLGRVSLTRIYRYHMLQRISLSRVYLYNLIGRVSLARTYKYNLIGRISLLRTYKYNILNKVSLSRVYKWNITNRVSQSTILKWDMLKRISGSKTFRWIIDFDRTTRTEAITGRTESRNESSKFFENWRDHFYRDPRTIHKRPSRFRRG